MGGGYYRWLQAEAEASEAVKQQTQEGGLHEFTALNTLLIVILLLFCILLAFLVKRNSFYYLPESAGAIFIGILCGLLARLVYPSDKELEFLTFDPEVFFFLLLPPIIFEAAYSLKIKDFVANFWTISLYAVMGTIISTFVIGYCVFGLALLGVVNIDSRSPLESLLFGALLSAIDPVATLSIMGSSEMRCNSLLYSLVFGESVLNDAVSIVLFNTFMKFHTVQLLNPDAEFSNSTIGIMLQDFVVVSCGSIVIGVILGLICSFIGKHTDIKVFPEYETSMLVLFAYGSFAFTESLGLSGIMSLFFYGIVLSYYNSYNLSPTSEVTLHNIFKSFSCLSEFFVFLYIGMGLFTAKYFRQFNFWFFVLCIVICIIARFLNTFPLTFLANFVRKVKVPIKMQMVIWFAGLRGAISFALSLNMPLVHRDLYVSTTLSVVVFTTVVFGGLTEPILTKMGMRQVGMIDDGSLHALGEGLGLDEDTEGPYNNVLSTDDDDSGINMQGTTINSSCSVSSSHGLTKNDRSISSSNRRLYRDSDDLGNSDNSGRNAPADSASNSSSSSASSGLIGRVFRLLRYLPKPNEVLFYIDVHYMSHAFGGPNSVNSDDIDRETNNVDSSNSNSISSNNSRSNSHEYNNDNNNNSNRNNNNSSNYNDSSSPIHSSKNSRSRLDTSIAE